MRLCKHGKSALLLKYLTLLPLILLSCLNIVVLCVTAAPDPPEIIKVILDTDSSTAIILWTNSADHGCFIMHNSIYYRVINERNSEPWSMYTFQPDFMQRVQRYLLQVQLDKMYEVLVTATNSEGESSKDLVTPTITGNVTKEPDKSKYFAVNRIQWHWETCMHTYYFPFLMWPSGLRTSAMIRGKLPAPVHTKIRRRASS